MNAYKCYKCGSKSTTHKCGELMVMYRPSYRKPNKQSTVTGYMKHFGSKAVQS